MSDHIRVNLPDFTTDAVAQARLQIWLSPAFPTGGFAYSHGLEMGVERGWVRDRVTLEAWLDDLLAHGSLHNDLVLLAASWRSAGDADVLAGVADLAVALQASAERHLEATQQGASFIAQVETGWPNGARKWFEASRDRAPTYAVAVGFAAATHAIPLPATLNAYAIAFISNLASAAIRLSIIGPTDAQRVIATLLDRVLAAAAAAERSTLDDIGGCAWRSDLAALLHETQFTRLFRS